MITAITRVVASIFARSSSPSSGTTTTTFQHSAPPLPPLPRPRHLPASANALRKPPAALPPAPARSRDHVQPLPLPNQLPAISLHLRPRLFVHVRRLRDDVRHPDRAEAHLFIRGPIAVRTHVPPIKPRPGIVLVRHHLEPCRQRRVRIKYRL